MYFEKQDKKIGFLEYNAYTLKIRFYLKKRENIGSSHCGAAETNPTSIYEDAGLIPGLVQWVRDPELL